MALRILFNKKDNGNLHIGRAWRSTPLGQQYPKYQGGKFPHQC